MDLHITLKQLVLAAAGGAFALSAAAQWQWIDKDGRKVFSDRPPSADIRDKDILKQPGGRPNISAVPAEVPAAGADGTPVTTAVKANANAPKISGKDTELEVKKKKADQEEAEKKKAEEEKIAVAKAENCARAKKGIASFQSGVRISTVNAKGEREIMDDNARAAESKRLQAIVDSDCK